MGRIVLLFMIMTFGGSIYTLSRSQSSDVIGDNFVLMDFTLSENGGYVLLNNNCDSIIQIPEISNNPASEFRQAVYDADLVALDDLIANNVAYACDFSSKAQLYKHWSAHNKKSTYWAYLKGYLQLDGGFLDDSTYVTPILARIDPQSNCLLENVLITTEAIPVYRTPVDSASVIYKIPKNKLIQYNPNLSVKPTDKYLSMEYPPIPEFDVSVWYYLIEYDGYVRNMNVIDAFYSSQMTFKMDTSGRWMLSDFIHFD